MSEQHLMGILIGFAMPNVATRCLSRYESPMISDAVTAACSAGDEMSGVGKLASRPSISLPARRRTSVSVWSRHA